MMMSTSDVRPLDFITNASEAADPIPFEENQLGPDYEPGKRCSVLVYDHYRNEYFTAHDVLFHKNDDDDDEYESIEELVPLQDKGYWRIPKKKRVRTIWGFVEFCFVLKRNPGSVEGEGGQVIFHLEQCPEVVAIKLYIWERVLRSMDSKYENPQNELLAMQHLGNNHKNVVGCLEVVFDGICMNAVLEYYNGGDLHDRLNEVLEEHRRVTGERTLVGLKEEEAKYWFRHLMKGIEFFQSKNICHRDLSPENVMLVDGGDEDWSLIIDLGMCFKIPCTVNENGDEVRCMINGQGAYGKKRYMAPELYRNETFDGFSIDIWAAGTILLFMLTGHTYEFPCRTDPLYELLVDDVTTLIDNLVEKGILSPSFWISDAALDLLQNIFRENPRDRLSLNEIMEHAWLLDEDDDF